MSYLVLARKWRPQSFEDLLGQEHVCKTLTNAIHQERLAHAFLFCGPRGIGKTSAARILAKTLVCPKSKDGKPCNQCSICDEIFKGSSVDVIEIDGASNNGVDAIRELRERANYMPTQGQYKIYIIDEVHMLSTSAFNALLKILEEPPAHLKFIFATTEAHKIPATILSRCQKFDFKKIPLKLLCEHLLKVATDENIDIENDAVMKIAKEARGSFRDALSLLDQSRTFAGDKITLKDLQEMLGTANEEALFDLLDKIFEKNASLTLKTLFQIYERGQDPKQLATELLTYFRALLLMKVTDGQAFEKENPLDLTDHEKTALQNLAHKTTLEELEQMFQILIRSLQDMSYTLHPRFVFEATLVKLLQLRPLVQLDELVQRVEALSQGEAPIPKPSAAPETIQWDKLVGYIKTKKPSLAALLEHGHFVG